MILPNLIPNFRDCKLGKIHKDMICSERYCHCIALHLRYLLTANTRWGDDVSLNRSSSHDLPSLKLKCLWVFSLGRRGWIRQGKTWPNLIVHKYASHGMST
jgi:hypothetical protein